MLKLITKYLRPYYKYIIIVLLFQLVQVSCTLYLPNMTAHIIDNGIVKSDMNYIINEGLWMLAISFVQILFSITATYFGSKAAFSMARDIRHSLYRKIQNFSVREMSSFGAPTLITRTTNDISQVQQVTMFLMTLIVASPIMFVGGIIMSLEQDVELSSIIAVTMVIIILFVLILVSKMIPYFQKFQKKVDQINLILREQISGIRVVKAFTREDSEKKRFFKANNDLYGLNVAVGRIMTMMFPIFMFILNVSILAIMWFGGIRVDQGEMEIGAITAFITYMMYIMMSVLMSSMIFMFWPRAEVSAKRIREVFKTKNSVIESKSTVPLNEISGKVEFKDAKFRYSGAQESVIRDVSFTALPGQTTAIIGSTGCGKSTLINLIPRLYDVTDGEVLFDSVNIKHFSIKDLASQISIVPQKSFLFSGTLEENLQFGKEDATKEEMIKALEIAQSLEFVKNKAKETELDDFLKLPVAQGGTNFSGGQRQRLAIARAIVRNPKVYIFDDSFSALDYATDSKLRSSLSEVTKDSTVIIVAQRVSTIRHAEKIIVMDSGKVVGIGTHEELYKDCQTYQEIVNSQLSAQEVLK